MDKHGAERSGKNTSILDCQYGMWLGSLVAMADMLRVLHRYAEMHIDRYETRARVLNCAVYTS